MYIHVHVNVFLFSPISITALLTPGNASNMPGAIAENADSAYPAEGLDNDDLGCYSDDDVGPANDYSHPLASPAKKSALEVRVHVSVRLLYVHNIIYLKLI